MPRIATLCPRETEKRGMKFTKEGGRTKTDAKGKFCQSMQKCIFSKVLKDFAKQGRQRERKKSAAGEKSWKLRPEKKEKQSGKETGRRGGLRSNSRSTVLTKILKRGSKTQGGSDWAKV